MTTTTQPFAIKKEQPCKNVLSPHSQNPPLRGPVKRVMVAVRHGNDENAAPLQHNVIPADVDKLLFKQSTTTTKDDSSTNKDIKPLETVKDSKFGTVAATHIDTDSVDDSVQGLWSLDNFELLEQIGRGGSSLVYKAREKASGSIVVLKGQKDDGDEIAENEIDIHQELQHPNICQFVDFFYDDTYFGKDKDEENEDDNDMRYVYMILELCDGGSVHDMVFDLGTIKENDAARYIRDAIQALIYLHSVKGIIHCDIKTHNFVLTENNQLKLVDFGFSVRNDEKFILGGTVSYMAPEHLLAWRDCTEHFDDRVDICSLGAALYEMLVGEKPFQVIGDDSEKHGSTISLTAAMDRASLLDDSDFPEQIVDLRTLTSDYEAFPVPTVPPFVSKEAGHLILSLMKADPFSRISLEDALEHPWIKKYT